MGLGRVLHWGPLVAIGDAFAHQWLHEIEHQVLTWTVFEGIIKWVSLATVYCSTMWWPPAGSLGGLAFLSSFLFFAGSDWFLWKQYISLVIFDLNLLHCQEWQCIIFSLPWWMDQAIFHLDGNLRRFSILHISFSKFLFEYVVAEIPPFAGHTRRVGKFVAVVFRVCWIQGTQGTPL